MIPAAPVLELIEAFRRSKAMFVATKLGIFDRLNNTPADVATLALELNANEEALQRLLETCASLRLLDKAGSVYTNTALADTYLCRKSASTLSGYILYSENVLYPLWSHLADAVREGGNRWKQSFGWDGPVFENLFASEQAMRDFLAGMHGFGMISSPAVVSAFDLSSFQTAVDLGGATGHLAIAACERYPALRAIVFDLPVVLPVAQEYIDSSGLGSRISAAAGDFFTDELPQADLYFVGRILHDWTEDKIRALLGRIHARLPAGGALLIAERLLDDDRGGPLSAHLQSLNMLVCTEGKERTLPEYARLLQAAGFDQVQGHRTGTPLDAILARKL
ncbi:MAG: methyltransferase [Bryobacteraceae bacterium]